MSTHNSSVNELFVKFTLGVVGVEGGANGDLHNLKGSSPSKAETTAVLSGAKFRRVVTKRRIVRKLKFSPIIFSQEMGRMDTRSVKRESTFEHCANISGRSAQANLSYMPAKF